MKIAILSDSHDHIDNTRCAVEQIQKLGAKALLFCGDFCAPGPARVIAGFSGPVYAVFGNNDGDRVSIFQKMLEVNPNVTLFLDGQGEFELAGKKIVINHYPLYALALARTGDYDLVAFGHDHNPRILQFDKTIAVNPGCLNIVKPNTQAGFALYDTDAHQAALYNLDGKSL